MKRNHLWTIWGVAMGLWAVFHGVGLVTNSPNLFVCSIFCAGIGVIASAAGLIMDIKNNHKATP